VNVLGLMSGTSLDGIDAAVVEISPHGERYRIDGITFRTVAFSDGVRERLLAALPPHAPPVAEVAALDELFGRELARAALEACAGHKVDAIASHGLTLYHRGEAATTMQIGAPYRLRDALEATVVYDFRRADCALGGHGAPLVPHFDALAFGADDRDVVALNLGGIANVSVVPRGSRAVAAAWDTGPANVLIDTFVSQRTDGRERFDRDGGFAWAGQVNAYALAELTRVARDYLDQAPPKSTGRERFGPHMLAEVGATFETLSLHDGCATLAAFTVATIADSLERFGPRDARLIVSGGGARNRALIAGLERRLGARGWSVASSANYGVDPDAKEAIAFAVFAYETLRGRPAGVPAATGASAAAVLGSIVPHGLDTLLAKIRAELAANGLG
jgi:anhydro-N-acetylmuramic acid kinase